MLNSDFLKGYMGGIISACDTSSKAYELCYNALDLAVSFDCKESDIKDAKIYCDRLIDMLYGN